tara:strand:- start:944 stop:1189 length:246 start_codon:yes stop_codon:yes gene_type:complete
MGKLLYWIEKILYVAIGLVVVVLLLSWLKIWSYDLNRYFLFVNDFESVLVLGIVVMGITFIMEKLWKWEIHQIFKPKRRRR